MTKIITRFAPSPTGYLHIGGIRTALINYLIVEKNKTEFPDSKFFLRIEDTDKKRSKDEYVQSIVKSLNWLNIKWDGDIYKQSENINKHIEIAYKLLDLNGAYKCVCTKEELEERRAKNLLNGLSLKKLCDKCEDDPNIQKLEKEFCIRIKIEKSSFTEINDEIQGKIKIINDELDNFILLRKDGTPTYMLSVVVDDYSMGITHIIRGDDHLNNAFRQFHLYKNLGWKVPKFAHIPLMFGDDGKKLSKRHGSVEVLEFKNKGYLSASIINYLSKFGSSNDKDEVLQKKQIIDNFNFKSIVKSPSRFDYNKLNFINSLYLNELKDKDLLKELEENFNLKIENNLINMIIKLIGLYKKRSYNLEQLNQNIKTFINFDTTEYKKIISENEKKILNQFYIFINNENDWSKDKIEKNLKEFVSKNNIKFSHLAEPLRMILTGSRKGPSLSEIMIILEKKETIVKINKFLL